MPKLDFPALGLEHLHHLTAEMTNHFFGDPQIKKSTCCFIRCFLQYLGVLPPVQK
jgi:hypothetical protein